MGLDMYLERHNYVKQWDHQAPEERYAVTVTRGGRPTTIDPKKVSYVVEQVAYWRKANAIHGWFVREIAEGEDDCKSVYVSREQLLNLVKACREVLADPKKAPEILPTAEGFFFGSTDYDEYYIEDLKLTIDQLENLPDDGSYYYRASW